MVSYETLDPSILKRLQSKTIIYPLAGNSPQTISIQPTTSSKKNQKENQQRQPFVNECRSEGQVRIALFQ